MAHKTGFDAARARLLAATLDTPQQYGGDRIGWFIEVRVDDLRSILEFVNTIEKVTGGELYVFNPAGLSPATREAWDKINKLLNHNTED